MPPPIESYQIKRFLFLSNLIFAASVLLSARLCHFYPVPVCSMPFRRCSFLIKSPSPPVFSRQAILCLIIGLRILAPAVPLQHTAFPFTAVSHPLHSSLFRIESCAIIALSLLFCSIPYRVISPQVLAASLRGSAVLCRLTAIPLRSSPFHTGSKQICAISTQLMPVHFPIIGHRCCSSPFHVYSCPFPLSAFLFIPSPCRCESSLIGPLPWQRNTFRFFSLPPQWPAILCRFSFPY